jgi:hypothetical protein
MRALPALLFALSLTACDHLGALRNDQPFALQWSIPFDWRPPAVMPRDERLWRPEGAGEQDH